MNISLKKKIILSVTALVFVTLSEYKIEEKVLYQIPSLEIKKVNVTQNSKFQIHYSLEKDYNLYWGYSANVIKEEEQEDKNVTQENHVEIKQKDSTNVLCIENSCYRLLGISQERGNYKATFYNNQFKSRLIDFKLNDILENVVRVEAIVINKIKLTEINTTNSWIFSIFDVNQTKYKPKDIEE